MTAAELLTKLTELGCRPRVDGHELALTLAPPPELNPVIDVLQCPLRGLMTGSRVFGMGRGGRPVNGDGVIDPRKSLPCDVALMVVESAGEWDRISPFARESFPHLFAPADGKTAKPAKRLKWERAR